MSQPHTLLALCGTSPAIITETIWALALEISSDPELHSSLPDRVIILTTTTGKRTIIDQLLTPATPAAPSIWSQLRSAIAELGIDTTDKLTFGDTSEHLKTFSRQDHQTGLAIPLDDIRDKTDQDNAADFILDTLRSITETPDHQLTVSLAGGRKTMSALLYGAMTLIGREHDRLTHVLVKPPFDDPRLSPKFYFNHQHHQQLSHPDKSQPSVTAASCHIELVDIPFVPLRYAFARHFDSAPPSFRGLIATYAHHSIHTATLPPITADTTTSQLDIGADTITLSPEHFAICTIFLLRAQQELPHYAQYKDSLHDLNREIQSLRHTAPPGNPTHWQHKLNATPIDDDKFRKQISSIRRKLQQHSPTAANFAEKFIQKGQVAINYPPDKITII